MKERLNELSLSQFIGLVCGELDVLLDEGERQDDTSLSNRASELIASYRQIADCANFHAWLLEQEERIKNKAKVKVFHICRTLLDYARYDDVRRLLGLLDEDSSTLPDEGLADKVEELLNFLLFEMRRSEEMKVMEEETKHSPEEIRAAFDTEIAFLTIYFKMPIDMNSVNAAVYANMVRQADTMIRNKRKV